MDNSLYAQVAKAAALMDRLAPGWERKVDLSTLDINSPEHCIAGQVFAETVEERAGFCRLLELMNCARVEPFDYPAFLLDLYYDAWIDLLKSRFEVGVLSDD